MKEGRREGLVVPRRFARLLCAVAEKGRSRRNRAYTSFRPGARPIRWRRCSAYHRGGAARSGGARPGLADLLWLPLVGLLAALTLRGGAGWLGARAGCASCAAGLLEIRWKLRQRRDVLDVVLDDEARFRVLHDSFHPILRGQRVRALGVEDGHALELAVRLQVVEVAGEDHDAGLLQLHAQHRVARRVPGRL